MYLVNHVKSRLTCPFSLSLTLCAASHAVFENGTLLVAALQDFYLKGLDYERLCDLLWRVLNYLVK